MKKAYYNNIECEIIAELKETEEVVIELDTAVYEESDEFGHYFEPIYRRIIVKKSEITDKKITKDNILEELDIFKKQERLKVLKEGKGFLLKAKQRERDICKKSEALESSYLKKVDKFKSLETMYKYLNGDYKYVVGVENNYDRIYGIYKLDEIKSAYNSDKLAAVSFRVESKANSGTINDDIKFYINQYYDDSGKKMLANPFETLEDAKEFFNSHLNENKLTINQKTVSECKKWNIENKHVLNWEEQNKKRIEDNKLKEVKKLQEKIKQIQDS